MNTLRANGVRNNDQIPFSKGKSNFNPYFLDLVEDSNSERLYNDENFPAFKYKFVRYYQGVHND